MAKNIRQRPKMKWKVGDITALKASRIGITHTHLSLRGGFLDACTLAADCLYLSFQAVSAKIGFLQATQILPRLSIANRLAILCTEAHAKDCFAPFVLHAVLFRQQPWLSSSEQCGSDPGKWGPECNLFRSKRKQLTCSSLCRWRMLASMWCSTRVDWTL